MIYNKNTIKTTRFGLVLLLSLVTSACVWAAAAENRDSYSNIKDDEFVNFFHTAASLDQSQNNWKIPIHGWIYEPQHSTVRKSLIAETLNLAYDLKVDKTTDDNFTRRINLLIADNERGKQIVIRIANETFVLPVSRENGHFMDVITLPVKTVNKHVNSNRLVYTAVTAKGEKRKFSGEVTLVSPTGISVISDIDDTIKKSQVTDHKALFNYTFYQDFLAAPGMANLYQSWSNRQAMIHFVSSSPWQLYAPLMEFTKEANFPWATFSLKYIRFRDETLLNLFKKGTETKPKQIEPILKTYPNRKFILVGDSGEQDPEVYASLIRKYPTQILRIYIRNVNKALPNDARFTKVFNGIDKNRWKLFTDPAKLELPNT